MTKTDRIKLDPTTLQWMITTLTAETTLVCCERCGLHYKPSLGHKCKEVAKGDDRGTQKGVVRGKGTVREYLLL